MEGFNWTTLLWIGGLVFVYLFGIFEGRSQGRKRRMAEEEQERKQLPPQTIEVDDPGLLRIKSADGSLALDLDGQRVNTDSLTPAQRKRLIEMLNAMRPWLEGKPSPAPATPPPSPPMPAPLPQTPPPPQPVSAPSSPKQKQETKNADESEAPPTSIVGQINLILQTQIKNTPLEAKGVSLMESASGGVNVYVGIKRYEAIDDVPDEEIKAAIRAAIAEWENRYTPGL